MTVVNSSTVPGTNSPLARETVERVAAVVAATCTADLGFSPDLSSLRLVIKHLLCG